MATRSRYPDAAPCWKRRAFLVSTASLAAWPVLGRTAVGVLRHRARFSDYPFQLGVASGDPAPDGFVLWTRLAPQPLEGGGMPDAQIEVQWQVAADEQMTRVVRRGTSVATSELAHSVHVEVEGLEPDRWYWYQFKVGDEVTAPARARTAPALDATPERLRFAFASCQHYETGFYTAYEHMAREDLDLVVHLGDYIYEGASRAGQVRRHVGGETVSLDDYRNRLAQYKTDPDLQAAHAMCPWLVTWDDHEFDNNYAGSVSEEEGVDVQAFLQRRAAAYRAYYEHMPLRRTAFPQGPDMQLYRRVPYGRLALFSVLDTRQYRTDQPCGDGRKPPCDGVFDPRAMMLGQQQEEWLFAALAESPARWNVLAQQVMMARVDRAPGEVVALSMDQWPGYEVNRRRVLRYLAQRKIVNPVVLTGDIHSNWVNDLTLDFDDPDSPPVATEFVGTSISSGGDGTQRRSDTAGVLAENPFVKFYNAERGYVRCEVTPETWQSDYRVVEYVSRRGAPRIDRASFVVEDGRPGAQRT